MLKHSHRTEHHSQLFQRIQLCNTKQRPVITGLMDKPTNTLPPGSRHISSTRIQPTTDLRDVFSKPGIAGLAFEVLIGRNLTPASGDLAALKLPLLVVVSEGGVHRRLLEDGVLVAVFSDIFICGK
ncbi:hypothetical protein FA13DRAFT_1726545 [Coprinellus micaceus]|uniref:Uncharacterized protein n=1 Tax=Coprinellus micaceus TaxID=71717 RepID=A0A4Y7TU93_COPMI|nr:hypothetical protein FA13DRAFT_1726545 [Coprinellus micaceus]